MISTPILLMEYFLRSAQIGNDYDLIALSILFGYGGRGGQLPFVPQLSPHPDPRRFFIKITRGTVAFAKLAGAFAEHELAEHHPSRPHVMLREGEGPVAQVTSPSGSYQRSE